MYTPCLCNADNANYNAIASSNPSALGRDLLGANVNAFAWSISMFEEELRKAGFNNAVTALSSFATPQKRLAQFLFWKNSAPDVTELAKHVLNVAKYSNAEAACDALASSYCVPRKADLTLPLWYAMVSSTHVCS